MQAPSLLNAPFWAMLGPLLALASRRNRTIPVLWVAGGATCFLLAELVERMIGEHWLLVLETPAIFTAYLAAVAAWQVTTVERATIRIATIALAVVYAGLVIFIPAGTPFGHLGSPIYAAGLFVGALWTLARRGATLASVRSAFRTDWAWILVGLACYGAIRLVSQPLGIALVTAQRPDLYQVVWQVRAVLIAVAFVGITIGCLQRPVAPAGPR